MNLPASRLLRKDLTGRRFGSLIALSAVGVCGHNTLWNCACDCGGSHAFTTSDLLSGLRHRCRKCGLDAGAEWRRNRDNGFPRASSRIYRLWSGIKRRCYNPSQPSYRHYGARGIKMCDEWLNDFPAFFRHLGHPPSPDHSIDRIDPNGNYEPGNVRWATVIEQANNRRGNIVLTLGARTMTLANWARELGMRRDTLLCRYLSGWTADRILTTPLRAWPGKRKK